MAGAEQETSESAASHSPGDIDTIRTSLGERLRGVRFIDLAPHTVAVDTNVRATCVLKVLYLNTTIIVATLHGGSQIAFPDTRAVAAACRTMTLVETDVDAVAVAIPRGEWPALLFTTAYMRTALELPGGSLTGPAATLAGYGLVDTLCKHLEGAIPVWEITERASNRIGRTDLHQIAARHAGTSIAQITLEGQRAHQAAKRATWGNLPDRLDERVARFVVAVVNNETVEDALAELDLETRGD